MSICRGLDLSVYLVASSSKEKKPTQKFLKNSAEMVGFGLKSECSKQEEENQNFCGVLPFLTGRTLALYVNKSCFHPVYVTRFLTLFLSQVQTNCSGKEHDGQSGRGSVGQSSSATEKEQGI